MITPIMNNHTSIKFVTCNTTDVKLLNKFQAIRSCNCIVDSNG